jgi:hypothetical protein
MHQGHGTARTHQLRQRCTRWTLPTRSILRSLVADPDYQ